MNKYNIRLSFLVLFITNLGFAQMKKAEKHFSNFNYAEAIPCYEKVLKGKTNDRQEAMIKLADCFRILNNYLQAEKYYAQAISIGKVPAVVNYNYGNILKSSNKYDEALNQYTIFLAENTSSKTAQNAIKSCKEIKYWESKPKEYDVNNIEAINTNRSEFSPVIINNKLVFVAEKVTDIVDFEKSPTNNQPFLDVFASEIKNNEFTKGKLFSKNVNSSFHDGPISFTKDGFLAAYTRVNYEINKKDKSFVNRAKIYFSELNGKSYSKSKPFIYNSDNYSCAHPALNADGTILFFSSDMPGTLGGHDIWMCKKTGDGWGKPINLGFDVNTSADEVFPTVKNDGLLYFSSNGLPGFGDLDIFSAYQKEEAWLLNRNEGLNLNSKYDDFGITFLNDTVGYFSSNREGGKGEDDIYSFRFTKKSLLVDGTVLLTENENDPAKGVKVFLLNTDGKALDSTKTNDKGYFAFDNLDADRTYMAEIEGTEANLKNKSRYYLIDKNSKVARITHNNGPGQKFVFKNLPVDPNGMPDLYNDDDLSIAGVLFYGDKDVKPLANTKVNVKNDYGDILESTFTDESGSFAFRNLPIDQNYSFSFENGEVPLNSKITLKTRTGKEIKIESNNTKEKFIFSLLGPEKAVLSPLVTNDNLSLSGILLTGENQKKALANQKVSVKNELGQIVATVTTDENGNFSFNNLPIDKNYTFSIDDSDLPANTKITLRNKSGKEVKISSNSAGGKYNFQLLGVDKTSMSDIVDNDILSLSGKLLSGVNQQNVLANKKVSIKNELGQIVATVTTDENGNFSFNNLPIDKNYTFSIDDSDLPENTKITLKNKSGKQVEIVTTTIGGKYNFELLGIDKTAMSDLANNDDINLSGVLLSGDKQKKVIANAKLSIKNELGEIVATVITDENGNFSFKNIPIDKNYTFSFDDSNLPATTKITLRNKNGNEVKIASNNTNGTFNFSLIGIEKTSMSDLIIEDKDLLMSVNGYLYDQNKKAISMAKVTVFNKNEVIENIITDDGGRFTIKNLGADKNYLFLLDDADSRFSNVTKIYVADSKGRIYKEVNRNTSGKFQFELLEVDRTALGNYLPEDVLSLTLKNKEKQPTVVAKKDNEKKTSVDAKDVVNETKVVNNTKVKKQKVVVLDSAMYYSYGLYEADSNGKNILDKVVSILNTNPKLFLEVTAHTDSRSSAAFNMTLSKKRANSAINYIISQGIDKSRLKGVGMGETQLLNNCKNDADCSEEEHAKNRRTEIKIIEVITL